jgi:hypothetical protein
MAFTLFHALRCCCTGVFVFAMVEIVFEIFLALALDEKQGKLISSAIPSMIFKKCDVTLRKNIFTFYVPSDTIIVL